MKTTHNALLAMTLILSSLAIAGCPPGGAKTASGKPVEGKYESKNENMIIELKSGGKAVFTVDGKAVDVTYEMDGPNKIIVHGREGMNLKFEFNADGNLSSADGLNVVLTRQ